MGPLILGGLLLLQVGAEPQSEVAFQQARDNGLFAQEAFQRCEKYLQGWLVHVDPSTGLIPRNFEKDRDLWVPKDTAADNFPFLFLSANLFRPSQFEKTMLPMLAAEKRLTSRVGSLPDAWSISRQTFLSGAPNMDAILFGAAEYARDGLLSITELLGSGPWSDRMDELTMDVLRQARFETTTGTLPLDSYEVNGEMLQLLCRSYWRTGDQAFLDAALVIGDYYLIGDALPTRKQRRLRMRDHGAEILAGLSELYVTCAYAATGRRELYRPAIHEMVNRVLEVGRNSDGLFYNEFDPLTGNHVDGLANTFGNVLSGVYGIYQVDHVQPYRDAVLDVLAALPERYLSFGWEGYTASGFADAIDGALGLYAFEPNPTTAAWLESQARLLWSKQQPDGTIEGDHRDGNFARTTLKIGLWKTLGLRLEPWRSDLMLGASLDGAGLHVLLRTEQPWQGRLVFDRQRHRLDAKLPFDHPRSAAFPEWYCAQGEARYRVDWLTAGESQVLPGDLLLAGIPLHLTAQMEVRVSLREIEKQ